MLTSYPKDAGDRAVWIDLLDPSDAERRRVAALLGAELPSRGEAASLALSERFAESEDMLRVNVPAFVPDESNDGAMTPLVVVLTPQLLVTQRYARAASFDRLSGAQEEQAPKSSVDAFVALVAAIAAAAADHMEKLGGELSQLSHTVFEDRPDHSRTLRSVLFRIGRIQRHLTRTSGAALSVERMLAHVCEAAPKWIGKQHVTRLSVVRNDLHGLAEFDQQLDDKLQFLLDATLGFINNDQNDLIKFLTIASVVTIPPMILAAVWGMNFKFIPEFDWRYGYPFAWAMLVLSIALPLAWFKWKRWF